MAPNATCSFLIQLISNSAEGIQGCSAPGMPSPRDAHICSETQENQGFQQQNASEYQHLWARQRPEGAAEGGASGILMDFAAESLGFSAFPCKYGHPWG